MKKRIVYSFIVVLLLVEVILISTVESVIITVEFRVPSSDGCWDGWSSYWVIHQTNISKESQYITKTFGASVAVNKSSSEWVPMHHGWNLVTASRDMYVDGILVDYHGRVYTWQKASEKRIVYPYLFTMHYKKVIFLYGGVVYRLYAFEPCEVQL